MNDTRQLIPIAGLVATFAMSAYMVIQLSAQTASPAGDFRNAAMAEVHNAQGQPILRGQFSAVDEEDDDVERKARLESSGTDADATGEAEIEFPRNDPARQEIEFSVQKLEPGTALTFLIDGQTIGQATVDRQGRAEIEITITGPASR
jgi:hypothetical protein